MLWPDTLKANHIVPARSIHAPVSSCQAPIEKRQTVTNDDENVNSLNIGVTTRECGSKIRNVKGEFVADVTSTFRAPQRCRNKRMGGRDVARGNRPAGRRRVVVRTFLAGKEFVPTNNEIQFITVSNRA